MPSFIYHFGSRSKLGPNIGANTIPEADWTTHVMGEETRFKLGAIRKGLYGSAALGTNYFGGPDFNWLMEIQIHEKCRKPENVASIIGLPTDPRFREWRTEVENPKFYGFDEFVQ